MQDVPDFVGLDSSCCSAKDEVVSKQEGVNWRAVRAKGDARDVVGLHLLLKPDR
jgi:hypothetical protein